MNNNLTDDKKTPLPLFKYIEKRTTLPPASLFIILFIALIIFITHFTAYLIFVTLGLIAFKISSHMFPVDEDFDSIATDDNTYSTIKSPSNSSVLNLSNNRDFENLSTDISYLKNEILLIKNSYNSRIEKAENLLEQLENKIGKLSTYNEDVKVESSVDEIITNDAKDPSEFKFDTMTGELLESSDNSSKSLDQDFDKETSKINDFENEVSFETPQFSVKAEDLEPVEASLVPKEIKSIYAENTDTISDKNINRDTNNLKTTEENTLISNKVKDDISDSLKTFVASGVGEWLNETIFGPFASIIEKAKDVYSKYKGEGKLPVFYLTTAGTVALLLCFAYLLQWSFANVFNEVVKVSFGVVSSVGLIIGGALLHRNRLLKEFGSTLVGLGVALNFLLIYYITIGYGFMPPVAGFILLAINSFLGYSLSIKFETKIVAIISFLGGAFTPFLLGSEQSFSQFYLYYLLLIAGATIYVAKAIKWDQMAHGSAVIITSIFQYILINSEVGLTALVPVHILFYLFTWYIFFRDNKLEGKFNKIIALILVGNISAFLYNIVSISSGYTEGIILLSNTVPFVIAGRVLWRIMTNIVKTITITILTILSILAIPTLLGLDIGAYIWTIEGLLMVYLGGKLKLKPIVREGYSLFYLSLIYNCYGLLNIVSGSSMVLDVSSNILLISIPLFTIMLAFITDGQRGSFNKLDVFVNNLSHFLGIYSLSIATIIISTFYLSNWSILVIIPVNLLMFIYSDRFLKYYPKINGNIIQLFGALVIITLLANGLDITTLLLVSLDILALTYVVIKRQAFSSRISLYWLFIFNISLVLILSVNPFFNNGYTHSLINIIIVYILPLFLLPIILLSINKFSKDIKENYDINIAEFSKTVIWAWIPISTFIFAPYFIEINRILLLMGSLLVASYYSNRFAVTLGRYSMIVIFGGVLSYEVYSYINVGILDNSIIIDFAIIGALFSLYVPLSYYLFINKSTSENSLFVVSKEIVVLWFLSLVFIISLSGYSVNSQYLILLDSLSIPLLLWLGSRYKIKLASVYLQPILALLTITSAILYLGTDNIIGIQFWHLLVTVLSAVIIEILFMSGVITKSFTYSNKLQTISKEMVSLSIASVFMVIAYKIDPNWFWVVSLAPLAFLLTRGSIIKSNFSQYLGALFMIFPIIGYFISAADAHSFIALYFPIYGKLASAEVALLFLIMVIISTKLKLNVRITKTTSFMNLLFYIVLPISFTYTVLEIKPNIFTLSLFLSVVIAYLVGRFRKEKLYKFEYITVWIGSFLTVVYTVAVGGGAIFSLDTLALCLLIIFAISHKFLDKSNNNESFESSSYKGLFRIYWFSYGIIPILISLSLFKSIELAILSGVTWLYILGRLSNRVIALKPIAHKLFVESFWLLILSLLISLYTSYNYGGSTVTLIAILVALSEIIGSLYFTGRFSKANNIDNSSLFIIPIDFIKWIVHISITISLLVLATKLPTTVVYPAQSILLLIHAVFLTFHSYIRNHRTLIKYAVILYAIFTVKVMFFDLATFSIPQKVGVFMVIALLTLGASFFLQKRGMNWNKDE